MGHEILMFVEQMEAGTAEIQRILGPQAPKVTTAQIQEALWHYYYDVDKSVAYLISKFVDPPAPKTAKSAPVKNKESGRSISICW
jgi:elongation factor 1 alpha-like protein